VSPEKKRKKATGKAKDQWKSKSPGAGERNPACKTESMKKENEPRGEDSAGRKTGDKKKITATNKQTLRPNKKI